MKSENTTLENAEITGGR